MRRACPVNQRYHQKCVTGLRVARKSARKGARVEAATPPPPECVHSVKRRAPHAPVPPIRASDQKSATRVRISGTSEHAAYTEAPPPTERAHSRKKMCAQPADTPNWASHHKCATGVRLWERARAQRARTRQPSHKACAFRDKTCTRSACCAVAATLAIRPKMSNRSTNMDQETMATGGC